MTQFCPDVGGS
jgi:hypothetical protein